MATEQDHHTNQAEVNLGTGAIKLINHDRLQCQDKTHPSWISADNLDQIRLNL